MKIDETLKRMYREHKKLKGRISNNIAWVFIVLQMMLLWGGLYAGGRQEPISFFNNLLATVQSVTYITAINILGIGALILSLIVWLYHKNKKGKVTTFAAIIAIILNTLCSCKLDGLWIGIKLTLLLLLVRMIVRRISAVMVRRKPYCRSN